MEEKAPNIASILDHLEIEACSTSILAIGIPGTEIPDAGELDAYETLTGPGDLPQALRAQLGIVIAPLEYMPRTNAEQLLSRLRDVHCDRVLLVDTGSGFCADALRALGYLEIRHPSADGCCYLFDPDMFSQPREWNNPSDWANPENFRKYRW
jgi:hypothetical protein